MVAWTDWIQAAAAVAVAGTAVIALIYAGRQLQLARQARDEASQPFVVAFLEVDQVGSQIVDLVVKNFGATPAYDIDIVITPAFVRTDGAGGTENVAVPPRLPVLVPGQEWRTFADSGPDRHGRQDLPKSHSVDLIYRRAPGRHGPAKEVRAQYETPSVLDWTAFESRLYTSVRTIHDLTNEVEKLRKALETIAGRSRNDRSATRLPDAQI